MAYYPPPAGYGYPAAPMMAPGYGAPQMMAPGYGGMAPGYGGMPAGYMPPPPNYIRQQLAWGEAYDRRMPFMIPPGLPPNVAQRMMQASFAFRVCDRDWSGNLNFKEFRRAMESLGYFGYPQDLDMIYYMIDSDRSGRISEREFCAYWGFHGWP